MKHTLAIATGLAALFVAVPTASAKGGKGGHVKGDRKAKILAKYDTNKDGALSKEEIAVMKPKLAKRLLKGDTDNDGALSATEFAALKLGGKHGKKHAK